MSRRLVWRSVGWAVVLAVGIRLLTRAIDPSGWLTADGLRAAVQADEWYGPLLYIATFMAAVFLPVPKIVLLGLAGVLFGPWLGFLCAWVGQVVGMSLLFVLARGALRDAAQTLLQQHFEAAQRIDAKLATHGFQVVALLRLFYFMGTPWSILLATTRVRVHEFVAGTAVGVIPAVALAVLSGDTAVAGATGAKAAVMGTAIVLVLGVGTLVRRQWRV